jgi:hypothetical protein
MSHPCQGWHPDEVGVPERRTVAMQHETKFPDPGTDAGMGLPSGKVFLALAALGLLLLALAALSSERVAPSPQRGPVAAKSVEVVPSLSRGFAHDTASW